MTMAIKCTMTLLIASALVIEAQQVHTDVEEVWKTYCCLVDSDLLTYDENLRTTHTITLAAHDFS